MKEKNLIKWQAASVLSAAVVVSSTSAMVSADGVAPQATAESSQLVQANPTSDITPAQVETKEAVVSNYNQQVRAQDSLVNQAQTNLTKTQTALAETQPIAPESIEAAERDLTSAKAQLESANQTVTDNQAAYDTALANKETATQEADQAYETVKQAQKQVAASQAQVDEKEAIVTDLNNQVQAQEAVVTSTQAELNQTQTALDQAQATPATDQTIAEAEQAVATSSAQVTTATQEVADMQAVYDEASAQAQQAAQEEADAFAAIQETQNQLQEAQANRPIKTHVPVAKETEKYPNFQLGTEYAQLLANRVAAEIDNEPEAIEAANQALKEFYYTPEGQRITKAGEDESRRAVKEIDADYQIDAPRYDPLNLPNSVAQELADFQTVILNNLRAQLPIYQNVNGQTADWGHIGNLQVNQDVIDFGHDVARGYVEDQFYEKYGRGHDTDANIRALDKRNEEKDIYSTYSENVAYFTTADPMGNSGLVDETGTYSIDWKRDIHPGTVYSTVSTLNIIEMKEMIVDSIYRYMFPNDSQLEWDHASNAMSSADYATVSFVPTQGTSIFDGTKYISWSTHNLTLSAWEPKQITDDAEENTAVSPEEAQLTAQLAIQMATQNAKSVAKTTAKTKLATAQAALVEAQNKLATAQAQHDQNIEKLEKEKAALANQQRLQKEVTALTETLEDAQHALELLKAKGDAASANYRAAQAEYKAHQAQLTNQLSQYDAKVTAKNAAIASLASAQTSLDQAKETVIKVQTAADQKAKDLDDLRAQASLIATKRANLQATIQLQEADLTKAQADLADLTAKRDKALAEFNTIQAQYRVQELIKEAASKPVEAKPVENTPAPTHEQVPDATNPGTSPAQADPVTITPKPVVTQPVSTTPITTKPRTKPSVDLSGLDQTPVEAAQTSSAVITSKVQTPASASTKVQVAPVVLADETEAPVQTYSRVERNNQLPETGDKSSALVVLGLGIVTALGMLGRIGKKIK